MKDRGINLDELESVNMSYADRQIRKMQSLVKDRDKEIFSDGTNLEGDTNERVVDEACVRKDVPPEVA